MRNIMLAKASKNVFEYDKLRFMKDEKPRMIINLDRIYDRWIVIPKKGITNAFKRLRRYSWVRDGYLEDAQWIFDNPKVSSKTKQSALANLERNGWTFKHEINESAM